MADPLLKLLGVARRKALEARMLGILQSPRAALERLAKTYKITVHQALAAAMAQNVTEWLSEGLDGLKTQQRDALHYLLLPASRSYLGDLAATTLHRAEDQAWLQANAPLRRGSRRRSQEELTAALFVDRVFVYIGGVTHAKRLSAVVPELPDDDELRGALMALTRAAMSFRTAFVAIADGQQVAEEEQVMHHLQFCERIIQNWADYLEVRE